MPFVFIIEYFGAAKDALFDFLFPESSHAARVRKLDIGILREIEFPREISGTLSLFPYSNSSIRSLVWEIKYRRNAKAISLAATMLHEHLIAEISERTLFESGNTTILIPIPSSKKRYLDRGFDHMKRVAAEIEKLGGGAYHVEHALQKPVHTPPQTKVGTKKKRLENLKGSFAVSDLETVRGKDVILIDDVVTTGATIKEARRALKAAGARRISAITIAH